MFRYQPIQQSLQQQVGQHHWWRVLAKVRLCTAFGQLADYLMVLLNGVVPHT